MNREKFEKKVNNKYGVSSFELANKSTKEAKKLKETTKTIKKVNKMGITALKVSDNVKNNKLGSYVLKNFNGASTGIFIAEGINNFFPALVPSIVSYYTGLKASETPIWEQALVVLGAASKPAFEISHFSIVCAGALVGILGYNSYNLVKKSINHLNVRSDVKKAKRLYR